MAKPLTTLTNQRRLLTLEPFEYTDHVVSLEEFRHVFELCGQFWLHDGTPAKPHAKLTTGKCSNGFINCLPVLSYPAFCMIMALQAVLELRKHYTGNVDWVIGSAYSSIDITKDIAAILEARHGFTEKGPDKQQVWSRMLIGPDEVVLQAEELMTTSSTTDAVARGIREGTPHEVNFVPYVLVLVHRSDVTQVDNRQVIYPYHFDMWNKEPTECPLCAAGSEAIPPKKPVENWARLTA